MEKNMIEFLPERELTSEIRKLLKNTTKAKVAVAYWGGGALDLLGLNPQMSSLEVVCCLKGGKSDPDVIKHFGKKAKQHDDLHAKVFWTPKGAIVGSANASSNGMPGEENISGSLIEAGMIVRDRDALAKIAVWFDNLYEKKSRKVTKTDLDDAREARKRNPWDWQNNQGNEKRKPLFVACRENPELFQSVFIAPYTEDISDKAKQKMRTFKKQARLDSSDFPNSEGYQFDRVKPGSWIIDLNSKKKKIYGYYQERVSLIVGRAEYNLTIALRKPKGISIHGFSTPFGLSANERALLIANADRLQRLSDDNDQLVPLFEAIRAIDGAAKINSH